MAQELEGAMESEQETAGALARKFETVKQSGGKK
jgi:hypothetical protein